MRKHNLVTWNGNIRQSFSRNNDHESAIGPKICKMEQVKRDDYRIPGVEY